MEAIFLRIIFFSTHICSWSHWTCGRSGAYCKEKGSTSIRIPGIFRKGFFFRCLVAIIRFQHARSHVKNTHTESVTGASLWGFNPTRGPNLGGWSLGDQLRLSAAHPDGPRDDSLCAQERPPSRPVPCALARRAPCGGSARQGAVASNFRRAGTSLAAAALIIYLYIVKKKTLTGFVVGPTGRGRRFEVPLAEMSFLFFAEERS